MLLLVLGLVMFIGLVVVHEFGHFIVARRNGVEVEEFGIFFPPRLWKKRIKSPKGDYDFTINALPLGGFVKLKGENDEDTQPGTLGAARLSSKVKIMLAGVGMNLATAFILLTLTALVGMPKLIDNQFTVASDTKTVRQDVLIGYVESGSPASNAGLAVKDKLLGYRVDGVAGFEIENEGESIPTYTPIDTAESLSAITRANAGKTLQIIYEREGVSGVANAQLRTEAEVEDSRNSEQPKGHLGISPTEYVLQRSTWSAPVVAGGLIGQISHLTLKGIGSALAGLVTGNTAQASSQVAGPVGIFVLLRDGSILGYQFILMLIAVISLTLALINSLPIPALDGGRLFVTLAFKAVKKPLKKTTENWIHGTGFALLMLLFVLITVVDVRRFF